MADIFKNKLISVITPIYDRTAILRQSIESVLEQGFDHFELLLIMDGSPQATRDVVMSYKWHPKVRIFETEKQTGNACIPRNIGATEARGEYLVFQDSDDIMLPSRLDVSFHELQQTDMIYGNYRILEKDKLTEAKTTQADLRQMLNNGNHINQGTVAMKRKVYLEAGGCKRKMNYCEDYELWCRIMNLCFRVKYVNEFLSIYRKHEGNLEKSIGDLERWKPVLDKEYRITPEQMDLCEYKEITIC
jgi:glycosyltransferase involved in cell wall biosynthesis